MERWRFWLSTLGLVLIAAVMATTVQRFWPSYLHSSALFLPMGSGEMSIPWPPIVIPTLLLLWPSLAVLIKRAHDRNRSGWYLLLLLIPVVGELLWLIDLGLLEGDKTANRFGPPRS